MTGIGPDRVIIERVNGCDGPMFLATHHRDVQPTEHGGETWFCDPIGLAQNTLEAAQEVVARWMESRAK